MAENKENKIEITEKQEKYLGYLLHQVRQDGLKMPFLNAKKMSPTRVSAWITALELEVEAFTKKVEEMTRETVKKETAAVVEETIAKQDFDRDHSKWIEEELAGEWTQDKLDNWEQSFLTEVTK